MSCFAIIIVIINTMFIIGVVITITVIIINNSCY